MIDLTVFADRLMQEMTETERKAREIAEKAEDEHGPHWGRVEAARLGILEGERRTLEALRDPDDMLFAAVASAISRNIRLEWRGHDDAIIHQHSVFDAADAALKAITDAFEKERSDGQ